MGEGRAGYKLARPSRSLKGCSMSWLPQPYPVTTQGTYVPAQVGTSSIWGDINSLIDFLVAIPQMIVLMVMMLIMSMLTRAFA